MEKTDSIERERPETSKKCPECFVYLPIDAKRCPSCNARIGKRTNHGLAKRPTNWKANIICILAWLVFIFYMKWVFFSD